MREERRGCTVIGSLSAWGVVVACGSARGWEKALGYRLTRSRREMEIVRRLRTKVAHLVDGRLTVRLVDGDRVEARR
jgi:hypothetical protein